MRWMWIDMMVAFEPGHRLTAVKNVSLAEDHLHDHFADQPIMPASLMLEGMAQTAGVLVGSTRGFKEKVILAKIGSATIDADVIPGQTIRYDAVIERVDEPILARITFSLKPRVLPTNTPAVCAMPSNISDAGMMG